LTLAYWSDTVAMNVPGAPTHIARSGKNICHAQGKIKGRYPNTWHK
jgi:hypothetical protein